MRKKEREALHQVLLQQRRLLLKEVADTEADLAALEGAHDAELEEEAQEETMRRLLDRLDLRAKVEVEAIDRALTRVADGCYGACLACEEPIPLARLRALPATPFCIRCATAAERAEPPPSRAADADASTRPNLPPEYASLSDRELRDAVREQLAADGRLDLDALRIVCRHGIVYLDGDVPSVAERQILLHTVTDVMGLTAVVDRVRVEHVPHQRPDPTPSETSRGTRSPWDDVAVTEDVTETLENGADFEAPTKPPPDVE